MSAANSKARTMKEELEALKAENVKLKEQLATQAKERMEEAKGLIGLINRMVDDAQKQAENFAIFAQHHVLVQQARAQQGASGSKVESKAAEKPAEAPPAPEPAKAHVEAKDVPKEGARASPEVA